MKQPLETVGIEIEVTVGDMAAALAWYEALLGRPPDADTPDGGARWEVVPYCWLHVAEGEPAGGQGPVRLGSADLPRDRDRVRDALGVAVSEIRRIEGMLAYCDFVDPWGNRLGLFQDLSDVTNLS
jgi:catechol 2,3-dioxygenase-like lactoylglutathione lyase family enzyme